MLLSLFNGFVREVPRIVPPRGKMPETDYEQMRASLEDEAIALRAEIERLEQDDFAQTYS